MIGIYKITNKLTEKTYIGQSIHCGKRLDEHCKGKQFIDEIIQVEGIENFTFEVLKQIENKEELSYWEDYFILKFDTMFPNGYNRRWNNTADIVLKIRERLDNDSKTLKTNNTISLSESCTSNNKNKIPFITDAEQLRNLAYNDCVYAWLLVHSHNKQDDHYYYIYKNNFTMKQIANDIHRTRQTVSKRINELIEKNFLIEETYCGEKVYKIPYSNPFQYLHSDTIINLLKLPPEIQKEELIKTLIYILKKFNAKNQENFTISSKEILEEFGHSIGNSRAYQRIRSNLATLQGAGIIKFKTICYNDRTGMPPQMYVYEVSPEGRASEEWLGVRKIE